MSNWYDRPNSEIDPSCPDYPNAPIGVAALFTAAAFPAYYVLDLKVVAVLCVAMVVVSLFTWLNRRNIERYYRGDTRGAVPADPIADLGRRLATLSVIHEPRRAAIDALARVDPRPSFRQKGWLPDGDRFREIIREAWGGRPPRAHLLHDPEWWTAQADLIKEADIDVIKDLLRRLDDHE